MTAFVEKPPPGEAPTDLINAGTYVLELSVLDRIAPDQPVNVERVTFPAMVADGTLYARDGEAYWIDAGTPPTYLAANLDLLSGRRGPPEQGIHPDAAIEGSVTGSWIGAGARVGADAVVEGSVVLAGAVIERGAMVRDAIIGAGARVGPEAQVTAGSVLGDDIEVPGGERLDGVRIPEEV